MIWKGLRFGMLLQLAVGPLCVLTFRAAAETGFMAGMQVTLAVGLTDALFIALSGLGAAAVLRRARVEAAVRWIGCITLCVFGADIALRAVSAGFLPDIQLFGEAGTGYFWKGFVLTASNPLTILFWGGVLTAQLAAHHYTRRQLVLFSVGCVLSTLLSLTAVAALGSVLSGFLPELVMQILNVLVGVVLIAFGLKLALGKRPPAQA